MYGTQKRGLYDLNRLQPLPYSGWIDTPQVADTCTRGSLSFIFTHPPEDLKKKKKKRAWHYGAKPFPARKLGVDHVHLLAQYLVQLQCKYPYDMILLWLVHVLVWGRGYLYLQDDVTLSRWLIEHHVPRLSVFYGNSM